MDENHREKQVQDKIQVMTEDAKQLHKLLKQRQSEIKANEEKMRKESRERMSTLDQIREDHSLARTAKNESKESERQKISRTLMSKLVTAADFPGCPDYVPAIINVLKNILGNLLYHFYFNVNRNYLI